MTDHHFLTRAVALSRAGMDAGEGGPFGAVVVQHGRVVGEGWNRVVASSDPTAHAEIVAIRAAAQRTGNFSLAGAVIFSSSEPCPMCWAAIAWARIDRVVYANTAEQAASIGFDDAALWQQMGRPIAARDIDAVHVPTPEAEDVFAAWRDDEDSVPY